MADFRRGASAVKPAASGQIRQLLSLPEGERHDLALELLEEFGANNIVVRGYEISLSCCLPGNAHPNGDRNPSAAFNWEKMVYNCYSCGQHGGLAWFISACRGSGMVDTTKWLAERNIWDERAEMDRLVKAITSAVDPPVKNFSFRKVPTFDVSVLLPWLRIEDPYMTEERGIPRETLLNFAVGWDSVSNRVIIPHFWKGELVGWQSRRILNDGSPKYKNSVDFPRDRTLYNFPDSDPLVVESPMSVLSKWHLMPTITATFGAQVTGNQILELRKFPSVTLWFDNDMAGWGATDAVGAELNGHTDVWVVDCEWAADPADLDDREFLRTYKERRIPYYLWKPPTNLKEWNMGFKKYATGTVIEETEQKHEASAWNEEDSQELAAENIE